MTCGFYFFRVFFVSFDIVASKVGAPIILSRLKNKLKVYLMVLQINHAGPLTRVGYPLRISVKRNQNSLQNGRLTASNRSKNSKEACGSQGFKFDDLPFSVGIQSFYFQSNRNHEALLLLRTSLNKSISCPLGSCPFSLV